MDSVVCWFILFVLAYGGGIWVLLRAIDAHEEYKRKNREE